MSQLTEMNPYVPIVYKALSNKRLDEAGLNEIYAALHLEKTKRKAYQLACKILSFMGSYCLRFVSVEQIPSGHFKTVLIATNNRFAAIQQTLLQGGDALAVRQLPLMKKFISSFGFYVNSQALIESREIALCARMMPFPDWQTCFSTVKADVSALQQREREIIECTERLYEYLDPNIESRAFTQVEVIRMVRFLCQSPAILITERDHARKRHFKLHDWLSLLLEFSELHWKREETAPIFYRKIRQKIPVLFKALPFPFPPNGFIRRTQLPYALDISFHDFSIEETLKSIEARLLSGSVEIEGQNRFFHYEIPSVLRMQLFEHMKNCEGIRRDLIYALGFPANFLRIKIDEKHPFFTGRESVEWLKRIQYFLAFVNYYSFDPDALPELLVWVCQTQSEHFDSNLSFTKTVIHDTEEILQLGNGQRIDIRTLFAMIERLRPTIEKNEEIFEEHRMVILVIFCRTIIAADDPRQVIEKMNLFIEKLLEMNSNELMRIGAFWLITHWQGFYAELEAIKSGFAREDSFSTISSLSLSSEAKSETGSSVSLTREDSRAGLGEFTFQQNLERFYLLEKLCAAVTAKNEHSVVVDARKGIAEVADFAIRPLTKKNKTFAFFKHLRGQGKLEKFAAKTPDQRQQRVLELLRKYSLDENGQRHRTVVVDEFSLRIERNKVFVHPSTHFFRLVVSALREPSLFKRTVRMFFDYVGLDGETNIECACFFPALEQFVTGNRTERSFNVVEYYLNHGNLKLSFNNKLQFFEQSLPKLTGANPNFDHWEACCLSVVDLASRYELSVKEQLNIFYALVSRQNDRSLVRRKLLFFQRLEKVLKIPPRKVHDLLFYAWPVDMAAKALEKMIEIRGEMARNISDFILPKTLYQKLHEFRQLMVQVKQAYETQDIQYQNLEWIETQLMMCFLQPSAWTLFFPRRVKSTGTVEYSNPHLQRALCFFHSDLAVRASWEKTTHNHLLFRLALTKFPNGLSRSCAASLGISIEELTDNTRENLDRLEDEYLDVSLRRPEEEGEGKLTLFERLQHISAVVCCDSQIPQKFGEINSLEALALAYPSIAGVIQSLAQDVEVVHQQAMFDFLRALKIETRKCWCDLISDEKDERVVDVTQSTLKIARKSNIYRAEDGRFSLIPPSYDLTPGQKRVFSTLQFPPELLREIIYGMYQIVDVNISSFSMDVIFNDQVVKKFSYPLRMKVMNRDGFLSLCLMFGRDKFLVRYTVRHPIDTIFPLLEDLKRKAPDIFYRDGPLRESEEEKGSEEISSSLRKEARRDSQDEVESHPVFDLLNQQLLRLLARFYEQLTPLEEIESPEQFRFMKAAIEAKGEQKDVIFEEPVVLVEKEIFHQLAVDASRSKSDQVLRVIINGHEVKRFDGFDKTLSNAAIMKDLYNSEDGTGEIPELFKVLMQLPIVRGEKQRAYNLFARFHQGLFGEIQAKCMNELGLAAGHFTVFTYRPPVPVEDRDSTTSFDLNITDKAAFLIGRNHFQLRAPRFGNKRFAVIEANVKIRVLNDTEDERVREELSWKFIE